MPVSVPADHLGILLRQPNRFPYMEPDTAHTRGRPRRMRAGRIPDRHPSDAPSSPDGGDGGDGENDESALRRALDAANRRGQILETQYAVSRAISEAPTLDAAVPAVLEAICLNL